MIWLFELDTESTQIETRHDSATDDFVLIVRRPDGTQQTEQFADAQSFKMCLEVLVT
jgi:hypothetical protein